MKGAANLCLSCGTFANDGNGHVTTNDLYPTVM